MDKAKTKNKAKVEELAVTATVTGPDGVTYSVTGCSVEEVQCAVEEIRERTNPVDIKAAPSLQGDQ